MLMVTGQAAYVAGAMKANKVIFMTNVDGLRLNDSLVTHITVEQAKAALPRIGFGMEKKVLAAIEALQMGVNEVCDRIRSNTKAPLKGDCA